MVQLGECLSSIPGALGFNRQHCINQSCNSSTKEVGVRESGVQSQSLLHSKFETSLGCMKKGKIRRQGGREGRREGGEKREEKEGRKRKKIDQYTLKKQV